MDEVIPLLIRECEEVVNGLEGLPSVTLPPGAPVETISAAHEHLGVPSPTEHSYIALLSDGIVLELGLIRYLPCTPGSSISIAHFDAPSTWTWAYTDFDPGLFDYVSSHFTPRASWKDRVIRNCASFRPRLNAPAARSVIDRFGDLPADESLPPGIEDIVGPSAAGEVLEQTQPAMPSRH